MALFTLVGKIRIEGAEESRSALGGVRDAAHSVAEALSSRLGSAVRTIGNDLRQMVQHLSLASVAMTGLVGAAAFKTAATMDSLTRALASVSMNAKDLEGQLARLKEVAKLPGLGFEEAVRGSVALQAAGYSARLSERALMAFGNALAMAGKGKSELDGVALALQQIASKGKISAEEINQLRERVPQVGMAMQMAFGTGDTEAIGKSGIGAVEFVNKLVTALEKLPRVTGGIRNDVENLQDGIKAALTPLGDGLAQFFGAFGSQTESLVEKFTRVGAAIGEIIAAIGKSGVIQEAMSAWGGGFTTIEGFAINTVSAIISAFKNLPTMFSDIGEYISQLWDAITKNITIFFRNSFSQIRADAINLGREIRSDFLKTIAEMLAALPYKIFGKTGERWQGQLLSSAKYTPETATQMPFTDLPDFSGKFSLFRDADSIAERITNARKPLDKFPADLIFGGGMKPDLSQSGGSVFAEWDKKLGQIEKNTKLTADALDSRRVFGGGELAKVGVTEAERSRFSSPDPYTRSVDQSLRSAIRRTVRADRMQTNTRSMPLWGR